MAGDNEQSRGKAETSATASDTAASENGGGSNQTGSERMSATQAATTGVTSIAELTGKQPEGVVAIEPTGSGWLIGVEVVEDHRVPSSADILATYEAELDRDGTLLACHRAGRYARGRGDSGRRMRS